MQTTAPQHTWRDVVVVEVAAHDPKRFLLLRLGRISAETIQSALCLQQLLRGSQNGHVVSGPTVYFGVMLYLTAVNNDRGVCLICYEML